MCGGHGVGSNLPEFTLGLPNGWTIGYTLYDFIQWLEKETQTKTSWGSLSDGEFARYYNEYINKVHRGSDTAS